MGHNLPVEIYLEICKYLDIQSEHKLKSLLGVDNICCTHVYKYRNYLDIHYLDRDVEKLEAKENLYKNILKCSICDFSSCENCRLDDYYSMMDTCRECWISICYTCQVSDRCNDCGA